MADTVDSFLKRREETLMAGEQTIPIEYDQLRETAREQLEQGPYEYVVCGAGTETTERANRDAFDEYGIVPRVLRDVSERDLGCTLFGRDIAAPFVFAPIGGQRIYHEEGELATARAASELSVPMAVANVSSRTLEDIADANGSGPRFFQFYWATDWDVAESFVKRAEAANYDAIMLTVDSPISKWRNRTLRNRFSKTDHVSKAIYESDPVVRERAAEAGQSVEEFVGSADAVAKDASLTWTDLDRLREWTDLPIVLKGIMSPEDARRAVEWGVDGLVVSTHGGRQIDGGVAALEQLPKIASAVGDETTILFDSGIRTGADVFKALALGADAIQFGRPYVFGLALAGQEGVRETAENCLAELESVMGLSGYASVAEITRDALVDDPGSASL